MYKIMIVEDDAVIAAEIRDYLCRWDMQGHIAHRLDDIVGEYIRIKPQLVIMDIALPFYNGFYWCQQLRQFYDTPIMFLSSRADNMDIVMAVNMGADDSRL